MCLGLKRWTSKSFVNHKVKREKKEGAGNESDIFHRGCADEADGNASLNGSHFSVLLFTQCFPWILHLWTLSLWESFKSGLISVFPSVSLLFSLHFYMHPHAHTFLSVTNEPAVKLMFCNHRANCRYPVSALMAANALDLSLGVHLKNLRESCSQWSEGKEERKPFHQQPSLSIRPLSQKGLQLLCNSPLTFCSFSCTTIQWSNSIKRFLYLLYSNVMHKVQFSFYVCEDFCGYLSACMSFWGIWLKMN